MGENLTTDHNSNPRTGAVRCGSDLRWILRAGAVAIVGAGLAATTAPPARTAVLSTGVAMSNGQERQYFGGSVCADVPNGNNADGVRVQAFYCNAALNQQFELSGQTIYALGGQRCLDVDNGKQANGTKVQIYTCKGNSNQRWLYESGQIIFQPSLLSVPPFCLDAGNLNNGTLLVINKCDNNSISQQWQIK